MAEFYFPLIPDALADRITTTETTQAISVKTYVTEIITDAADNIATLPAGLKEGQLKKIIHHTDGGACAITLDNAQSTDYDVVTLTNVGEFVVCMWNGSYWRVLESGKVDSAVDIVA
tara:strand:+ start:1069 stop:1419 length:351 start_codon:yes stop_codon:yes gene_type:complete